MDIAAVAMDMKAAEIANQTSIAVLKNTMDCAEAISTQLIDQLLTLDVGAVSPSRMDISI